MILRRSTVTLKSNTDLLFSYPVRLARVDLDNAPHWFRSQAADHWSADKVRETAGTQGCELRHLASNSHHCF